MRLTRRRIREDIPNLYGIGKLLPEQSRGRCRDSTEKLEIWKSTLRHTSPSLFLSLSSSPPLITPQEESVLEGFPKLSGVRREALTQHCLLCMHGSSWMQPMKRAYLGRVECCYPGAMAEARWTFWQISESVVTKSIKQLLFPGKTEQTRWRKKAG